MMQKKKPHETKQNKVKLNDKMKPVFFDQSLRQVVMTRSINQTNVIALRCDLNVLSNQNLGVSKIISFDRAGGFINRKNHSCVCGSELETCSITHQRWFHVSVCSIRKHVLSIGDSHNGCTALSVTWYRPVPVYSRDSNCVDVVYVTAERTTVSRNATIACSEDKD